MTQLAQSSTYINAGDRSAQGLNLPSGGVRGLSVRNPTGYTLRLTDGSRTLLTIPPMTLLTGPLLSTGTLKVQTVQGNRALGSQGTDNVAAVILYNTELPASSAALDTTGPRGYTIAYNLPVGATDLQVMIPSGYTVRQLVLSAGVTVDVTGRWFSTVAGGTLSNLLGTQPAELESALATGQSGTVNLAPLGLTDSYTLTNTGSAGTGFLILQSVSPAAPVLIYPHGAASTFLGGLGGLVGGVGGIA